MAGITLIIDYEAEELRQIATYLGKHGFEVLTATDAREGIDLFFEQRPDIIFVNMLMPTMNGAQFCKSIRSRHEGLNVAIYLMSPLATGGAQSAMAAMATGTISKPVNLGRLLGLVEKRFGPGDPRLVREMPVPVEDSEDEEAKDEEEEEEESLSILDKGRIEEIRIYELLASLAGKGFSGRLEIRSGEVSSSILWKEGLIAGLYSSALVAKMEREGKLNRREAQGLRKRYREEGVDLLKTLKELGFSDDVLENLEKDWRENQLKGLTTLKMGVYRVVQGPVEGSMTKDPYSLIHFALNDQCDMAELQSRIEEQTDVGARFYRADAETSFSQTENTRIERLAASVMDRCGKGATLGELFTLDGDPGAILSTLYALLIMGRVMQNPSRGPTLKAPVKKSVPSPPTGNRKPKAVPPSVPKTLPSGKPKGVSGGPDAPDTALSAAWDEAPGEADSPDDEMTPLTLLDLKETLKEGDDFFRRNIFSRAQECYDAVVMVDPSNVEARVKLARATYRNKFLDRFDRFIDAVQACKAALVTHPKCLPAYLTLMRIYEEEDKNSLARQIAGQGLEQLPKNEEIERRLKAMERALARA